MGTPPVESVPAGEPNRREVKPFASPLASMRVMTTDADLLRTDTTFETFVQRHRAMLHRYVVRRLGPNDADDIVNEVFTVAFVRRQDFDGTNARPWLFGITTNLIRRHARTEARQLRDFGLSGIDPQAPERPEADVAVSAAVARALHDMKPKHRDALFLFAVAGLPIEEIAQAMDAPVATVKTWIHRARKHGQKVLDADGFRANRTGTEKGRTP